MQTSLKLQAEAEAQTKSQTQTQVQAQTEAKTDAQGELVIDLSHPTTSLKHPRPASVEIPVMDEPTEGDEEVLLREREARAGDSGDYIIASPPSHYEEKETATDPEVKLTDKLMDELETKIEHTMAQEDEPEVQRLVVAAPMETESVQVPAKAGDAMRFQSSGFASAAAALLRPRHGEAVFTGFDADNR